jgi:DNA-binding beta-propeller fold protein YncE
VVQARACKALYSGSIPLAASRIRAAHKGCPAGVRRTSQRSMAQGSLGTRKAGPAISMPSVGGDGHPNAIAITPNGRTVYIPGADAKVHTIAVAANKPGPVIAVGNEATAVAITPNGETAYVAAGAGKI